MEVKGKEGTLHEGETEERRREGRGMRGVAVMEMTGEIRKAGRGVITGMRQECNRL